MSSEQGLLALSFLLDRIEAEIRTRWVAEVAGQADRLITHRAGDLLWRDNVGWAVCLEDIPLQANVPIPVRLDGEAKRVAPRYYVNVTEWSTREGELAFLMDRLRSELDG